MNFFKSFISLTILLAAITTTAQQDPNYTIYRYTLNLVNPAYAGASKINKDEIGDDNVQTELGFNIRSQWASLEGAPETQSAFFSTGVGKNLGLGVSIINDRTFVESRTSLNIDFSYKVRLNYKTELFLGIKAGANSYNVNTQGLTTFGIGADPSLSRLDGNFTPNVGAGALLKGDDFFVAFSIPRILSPDRLESRDGLARLGRDRIHVYLALGYDIPIGSGDVIFKPSAQVRYVDAAPTSLDLTTAFMFSERFEIGAAYRLNEGLGGIFIFKAANWLDIGYAYEGAIQNSIALGSNGTHEIYSKFKL